MVNLTKSEVEKAQEVIRVLSSAISFGDQSNSSSTPAQQSDSNYYDQPELSGISRGTGLSFLSYKLTLTIYLSSHQCI